MKLLFFLFLLLVPSAYAIAISPAHATFVDNHATIYLLPERAATYIISGDANYQEVIVMNISIYPVYLTLNQTAQTQRISITEKPYNANALTLLPGISIPYTIEKQSVLNKITGNAIGNIKTVLTPKTKQIIIGILSALFLVILLYFLFFRKKKETGAKPVEKQTAPARPPYTHSRENPKFRKVTQKDIRRKR